MPHALATMFDRAVNGSFPDPDGVLEVVAAPAEYAAALVSFSGHIVLAADVEAADALARVPVGDFAAPQAPEFLSWVAASTESVPGVLDALLVAVCAPGAPDPELELIDDPSHPRVARSLRYRRDVRVYTTADQAGMLILGRGLTRRWEMAFEVDRAAQGRGLGRALARAATMLLPPGTPVWAQVSPGNAASVRAVIAAGYQPIGAEMLFHTHPDS